MSRHRSPAGRHAHPWPAPPAAVPRAWPRPAPGGTRPAAGPSHRHAAAPAVRNGLAAAAATGGVLAVTVPVMALLPAEPASGGTAALTLTTMPVAEPADVTYTASVLPVSTVAAGLPPAVDVDGLVKAAGIAEAARLAEEARLAREAAARCDAELDGLGRVKPWVRDGARFLSCLYEEPTLIGVAGRSRVSDHPRGLAVDLMTRGEKGDRIAECALENQEALGVSYVIWQQRVNYGDGWERMSDRGSDTENHFDHVHVSFERGAGSGDPIAAVCG